MSTSYKLCDVYSHIFKNVGSYNEHNLDEPRYVKSLNFLFEFSPSSVLDVGSGKGNFLSLINKIDNKIKLYSCDFENFHKLNYVEHYNLDIRENNPKILCDSVVCLDVLEHLPLENIPKAISNMSRCSNNFVFSVSNHSDIINNIELHLTQINFDSWRSLLENYCKIKNTYILNDITYLFNGTFK